MAIFLVITAGSSVDAQVDTRLVSVTGQVFDQTGAVVPQASITVRRLSTGVERSVSANGEGVFSIDALQPGDYEVSVAINESSAEVHGRDGRPIPFRPDDGGKLYVTYNPATHEGEVSTEGAPRGAAEGTSSPSPLGATPCPAGVNFSVYAKHATGVELLLFDRVDDAKAALDFYCRVLGATERMRMPMQNGKIAHAEIAIGDSVIMLADEAPEMGARSPKSIGGTPSMLYVYVEDVDRVFDQAVHSGSTVLNSVQNKFYGDRSGTLKGPFGHVWTVATHVEHEGYYGGFGLSLDEVKE